MGWVAVDHEWEDLCERHGLIVLPNEVPSTVIELRAARFFVNAFSVSDVAAGTEDQCAGREEVGRGAWDGVWVRHEVHMSHCSHVPLTFCQCVSRVSRLRDVTGQRKRLGAGRTVRGGDGGMDMCQARACL